ncbi:uncharacterized protein LOC122027172 isoform X1 [Zingiber officinale]|uniref:Uncharacterized protein n=1 Tax=Zingiber officinale TaxID=94328 RepID=A0A8J5CY89_ZINOF|nr:uncharacterized protein LOC122027172 isoform X1 [Zingiber officinale]KAG6474578.1 hypothetical protein ZIOFF_068516 [Zingiber officinale]
MASTALLSAPPAAAQAASVPAPKQRVATVHLAAVPLRAAKGPAQTLLSAAYSVGVWQLQHFVVIIRPDPSQSQVVAFDFQPQDPENFYALLAVLTQKHMPGVVLRRSLRRLPNTRCWFIGFADSDDAVDEADRFSKSWSTELIVGEHDCRHFANGYNILTTSEFSLRNWLLRQNLCAECQGLVECLTGERHVLSYLQTISH